VDTSDQLRLRERENIVVTSLIARVPMKIIPVKVMTVQTVTLDHRAHCTIQNQDSL